MPVVMDTERIHRSLTRIAHEILERNRGTDARRKAERHAAKAAMEAPRCEQCGKTIEGAIRLISHRYRPQWARKFCGNTCRQAAFRARNG